jgi:uncharacterized protein
MDDAILKYAHLADEVWHAGDIGDQIVTDSLQKIKYLRAVYGNIDDKSVRLLFPVNNRFMCEGVDVFITHIGANPRKFNPTLKQELLDNPPKLFICGHTHVLKVHYNKKRNYLEMNPGACGIFGSHPVRTMLRFVIDGEKISNLEVIELGKR